MKMAWKLFLDDERFPPDDGGNWKIARTPHEAFSLISEHGMPEMFQLDHDLGEGIPTGYDFVKEYVDGVLSGFFDMPDDFYWHCHSQNPVGVKNMNGYLAGFQKEQQRSKYVAPNGTYINSDFPEENFGKIIVGH